MKDALGRVLKPGDFIASHPNYDGGLTGTIAAIVPEGVMLTPWGYKIRKNTGKFNVEKAYLVEERDLKEMGFRKTRALKKPLPRRRGISLYGYRR